MLTFPKKKTPCPGWLVWIITVSTHLMTAGQAPAASPELIPVRFASVPAIVEAPSHVAYQKKYFQEQGLDLELEMNPDGKTSLAHLFDGRVDIAAVMGTPVVYSSFERDDFYIIAKMSHEKIHSAVARVASGITGDREIKGKKVAVMRGTSGHFFLDSWLLFHGLTPRDIHLVHLNGPQAVEAMTQGRLDAMFYWFPFPEQAKRAMGNGAVELPTNHHVPGSWVIVVKKAYAHANPEVLKRFLLAIRKAEAFIRKDPDAAMAIHSRVSGVALSLLAGKFRHMDFGLCLDQDLILDLEDQARWIIGSGYTPKTQVPNYLTFLFSAPLHSIDPKAVRFIHGDINDN